MTARRVLVIGGSGAFGSRLVERLLATTDFVVVIAGRDKARIERAARELSGLHPGFAVEPVVLDTATLTADDLKGLRLWAVVDAAGPWQGATPRVAEAAIDAGCHYVDLADARDFVRTIPPLDARARRAGVVVLTGASSTPGLSNAVLDRMTRNWGKVETVFAAIASGNRAPRGKAVIRAILSWAGRPVRVFENSVWQERPGWDWPQAIRIEGLGRRWVSLAETPDLDLLAHRYRPTRAAVFKAGLELPVLHFGLWALAQWARLPFVGSLTGLAEPLRRMALWLDRLGSDRGGMLVEAVGTEAAGRRVRAVWQLVAEAGSGPTIPTLPAVAALKVIAAGKILPRADIAAGRIPLDAIEAEIERLPITVTTRTDVLVPQFRRALAAAFDNLPTPVRGLHSPGAVADHVGEADIYGAKNPLARAIARLIGLPREGHAVPLTVRIEDMSGAGADHEVWTRDFAGRRFASHLSAAEADAGAGVIEERFGPFRFRLALEANPYGLVFRSAGWRIGRLPLPALLGPEAYAVEAVDEDGRFTFDVEMSLPLRLGRLVRYRGHLAPVRPAR
ncbi:hypothetical protein ABB55_18990 [Prosthecomicrobium hirschii]|uniref:Saccharopine dehydrogenase n=2 Tax=Prosthecodimorpha hirschii TaxID=665126 RepID=A0A0P6WH78_9HYPH|nr:SDR family oxidoreductase [Prosthecomicrobium hirschii]KPL54040.1 hypothetical protein ABB55_18990 [Prosthecomicrobium hirschii]